MHETEQEGSRALEAKVGGELMAVQMPRQSSLQVDGEQGLGRRARGEWGGGPVGSWEEGPRGVGRRASMEWGGGPVSVCCGVGVTREEGRFPEQETSRTCYRQCAVDLDLHSVFPSNNFLASTYWPHFTDLAESAASPRTPGRALRLGLLDAEGSVPSGPPGEMGTMGRSQPWASCS